MNASRVQGADRRWMDHREIVPIYQQLCIVAGDYGIWKMRILIVDDQLTFCMSFDNFLKVQGNIS